MNPDNSGAAIYHTGEVGPPSCENNAVEKVFSNSLIWKTIGSYLNVADLKACRLVNSSFHAMVMKETNFLKRSLVSLKLHQITRNIFGSSSEPWKNVYLEFGNPGGEWSSCDFCFDDDDLEWLCPLVSNVESLSLRMQLGRKGGDFYPVVKRLLNATKKLRALAMEPIFLMFGVREGFDACKDTLANLEEFELLEPPSGWQNHDLEEWSLALSPDEWLASNLFVEKTTKIRALRSYYPAQPVTGDDEDEGPKLFQLECLFLGVLIGKFSSALSNSTLKNVTVPECWFWQVVRSKDLMKSTPKFTYPHLKSATFRLSRFHTCKVSEYLMILPMLEELDFAVRTPLPMTILDAIAQRSHCLRKLKLESMGFKGTKWQFLKNTKIEEFQLESLDCAENLPDEALNCLPLTIKKLILAGPLESNPIPALARLNPSLVTELEFIDSGDCFTNDTMKYILENFKMLRKLNVINAEQLTDAGFVGSFSESGSLSRFKGLRTLILRGCGSITDATLKEIRFLELRYLDISDNKHLTKNGYEELRLNNPSLETVDI